MTDHNDETRSDARQILSLFSRVRIFTFQQASGWLGLDLHRVDRAIQYLRLTGQITDDKTFPEYYVLPEPPESPHAAPKPADPSTPTTAPSDCNTGQEYDYYAPVNAATESVKALADAYVAANAMLIALRADNEQLRKENEQFRRKYAQTEDFSGKYIALKGKLRGLLDAD